MIQRVEVPLVGFDAEGSPCGGAGSLAMRLVVDRAVPMLVGDDAFKLSKRPFVLNWQNVRAWERDLELGKAPQAHVSAYSGYGGPTKLERLLA